MKKLYLLDTNIVSEFSKERPNENVKSFYNVRKDLCAISAVTWQELTRGVERMPDCKKKNYLMDCMDVFQETLAILPYDEFSAKICGEMQAAAEKAGRPLPFYDSQIAATAMANGMILVTHNTEDFSFATEKAFLRMEDWFK